MPAATFKSVVEMFHHRVRSTPDGDAFYYRKDGQWLTILWKEVGVRARNVACGLRSLGIQEEQRVAIQSNTRLEWVIADNGILCAGAACTTIYPSSTPEEISYIVLDSDTRIVVAENDKQVEKLQRVRAQLPGLVAVVVMQGTASADGWVLTLDELERRGAAWDKENPGAYDTTADAITGDHLATLIYTSGTTGNPKGVILTHDCWVFEGEAIDACGILSPADKQFLFLPLAHSFGKVLQCAQLRIGFASSIDGDIESLIDNLAVQKPTFMGAVPRIFEKAYNRIISMQKEKGGITLKIFTWAIGVGREVSKLRQAHQEPTGLLAIKYKIADKLVFSKIRARFGGNLRFFISGAAALSREIAEFFHAAGIVIAEGYGLTESSAASFVNRPENFRFGTVGPPLPGVEVKIADDGEILLRGRGIMRGYYNKPEQSAETLNAEGWLLTGDIGQLEEGGFLRITDRKKDLIKTSGGKYVAPQELEGRLKSRSTLISQVIVHGNNRNFCTALVAIAPDSAAAWARGNGVETQDYNALLAHPKVKAELDAVFAELNKELPSYSTLKKYAILPKDLSQDDGDLTPSLKVKRKVVETKYKDILDGFYAGALADT